MKNVLMSISIMDKNYLIVYDDTKKNTNALGLGKNKEVYQIVSDKEITLINSVIDNNIRKVFFECGEISFNGEGYLKLRNRYNGSYYFAKNNGDTKILEYDNCKELYDLYNPKDMVYADFGEKYNSQNSGKGKNFTYGTPYNNGHDNFYEGRGSNNIGKKIAIAFAGLVGTAIITLSGIKLYSHFDVPPVTSANQVTVNQDDIDEYGIPELNVVSVEDKNLSEDEIALKQKYETFKTNLEKQGLTPWEISIALSHIKQLEYNEEYLKNPEAVPDNISFYYDSDTNSVLFIYDNLDRTKLNDNLENSEKKEQSSYDYDSLSQNVKELVDAITNNQNLSNEYKNDIINNWLEKWEDNSEYLSESLQTKLRELIIEYDPNTKANTNTPYNSHNGNIGGIYHSHLNKITLYDLNSFDHEVGHVMGNFGSVITTLLNEGYNEWKNGSDSEYIIERYVAYIYEEIFGEDTLRKGYFSKNLHDALVDKLVQTCGVSRDEVEQEVDELLETTQYVLYFTGEKTEKYTEAIDVLNDPEVTEAFSNLINHLNRFNEKLGNQPNSKLTVLEDFLTKNNESGFFKDENEKILSISHLKSGEFLIEIGARKTISDIDGGDLTIPISRFKIVSSESELNSDSYDTILDSELRYPKLQTFNNSEQVISESAKLKQKNGNTDCMEDPNMRRTIIDRIIRFLKLKTKNQETLKENKNMEQENDQYN